MFGTVAEICVPSPVRVEAASVEPNLTVGVPVKLIPLIVTVVPAGPTTGLKSVTSGAEVLVKLVDVMKLAVAVVTLIGPVPGLLVRSTCKLVSPL